MNSTRSIYTDALLVGDKKRLQRMQIQDSHVEHFASTLGLESMAKIYLETVSCHDDDVSRACLMLALLAHDYWYIGGSQFYILKTELGNSGRECYSIYIKDICAFQLVECSGGDAEFAIHHIDPVFLSGDPCTDLIWNLWDACCIYHNC